MSQEQKRTRKTSEGCSDDDERMSGSSDQNGPGGLELEAVDGVGMDCYTRYEELSKLQEQEAKINQRLISLEQELHKSGRLITDLYDMYRTLPLQVQQLLQQTMHQHQKNIWQYEKDRAELYETRKKIYNCTHPASSSSSVTSSIPLSVSTPSTSSLNIPLSTHYFDPNYPPTPIISSSQSQSFVTTSTSFPIASTSFPVASTSSRKDSRIGSGLPDFSVASTESLGSRSATPQERRQSFSMISSRPSSRGASPSKPE